MLKKKKNFLATSLLVSLLVAGLAGCGDKPAESTSGNGGSENVPPSVSEVVEVVTGVEITYDGETTVLGGDNARLSAKVLGKDGGKVTWSSSDETIASVSNGVVSFKNVTEDKTVTITATSRDDATKKDSVEFTVKYSSINFANSRGAALDSSLFLDEGTVTVDTGDTALLFNGVHGSKWFVEADITISGTGFDSDEFPKFGLMTGTSAGGWWNGTDPDTNQNCENLFYYVDAQRPASNNSWGSLGFVGQNDEFTDWGWGMNNRGFGVDGDNKCAKDSAFKMGMLRDGVEYFLFAGVGEGYKAVAHFVDTKFDAETPTYAWIAGWHSAMTVGNIRTLVGDAVNEVYQTPTAIELSNSEQTLYLGDSYQLSYSLDVDAYNPALLEFTSSDETVATVSSHGLITANTEKGGTATIKVSYGTVETSFTINVTTDVAFKVDFDGKMDDVIWNDNVKTNKYTMNSGTDARIDLYGSRNDSGVYLFADYYVTALKGPSNNWWENDNFEGYFGTLTTHTINGAAFQERGHDNDTGQCWISSNKTSNFEKYFISDAVKNEETGLYNIKFEVFMSYERLGVAKDEFVTFRIGSAPAVGWYNCGWWTSSNFGDFAKITNEGLKFDVDPALTCAEGHNFSDWAVTTPASCAADGEQARKCKVCNTVETQVILKGEHAYTNGVVTTVTAATCTTAGEGTIACDGGCGTTIPVAIPAHASTWDVNHCTVCNTTVQGTDPVSGNFWDAGGWENNEKPIAQHMSGDFKVEIQFTMQVNGIQGNWWRGALPYLREEGVAGKASVYVVRFDWWGWCDKNDSEKALCYWPAAKSPEDLLSQHRNGGWEGSATNANGETVTDCPKFEEIMSNVSTVKWVCSRTTVDGVTTILNEFYISYNGFNYYYWSKGTNANPNAVVTIGLSAEFAKWELISSKVVTE